jgi:hypothetical protein
MSDGTVKGLPENKRSAIAFVNGFRASGKADPVAGLRAAFATKPHIVYLVTDRGLAGGDGVIEELREVNREKLVKVYTVALQPPAEAKGQLLRQIADEHGGTFKVVAADE